jgi:hypothetical protein
LCTLTDLTPDAWKAEVERETEMVYGDVVKSFLDWMGLNSW